MLEHDASHLIAVERRSKRPIGVLSTLDIARALARFPETHPVSPPRSQSDADLQGGRAMNVEDIMTREPARS